VGTYVAELTVTDGTGCQSQDRLTLNVTTSRALAKRPSWA
jgi:hypothetical protein